MGKLSGTDSLEDLKPDLRALRWAILDGFAPNKYDFVYLPFDRKKEKPTSPWPLSTLLTASPLGKHWKSLDRAALPRVGTCG
ncbi:unnamed protein product [Effrenium voratum]|nr:unnamed protein product [Effrenium voratum]